MNCLCTAELKPFASIMLRFSHSIRRGTNGKFPSVSINDHRASVEVHQPFIASNEIFHQVGTVEEDEEVTWSEAKKVDGGRFPKVTCNQQREHSC